MGKKAITDWREALAFVLLHPITFSELQEDGLFRGFHGIEKLIGPRRNEQFQKRLMRYPRHMELMYSREVLVQAAQAIQMIYSDEYDCDG